MNLTKRGMIALLCVAGLTGAAQAAKPVVKMIGDNVAIGTVGTETYMKRLTTNLHMVASNEYHLDGIITVNPGVILTIDFGTVIRGYNENSLAAFRTGILIVERGAKIYAMGTAAKPIIFTDQWDNNVPGEVAGSVTRTWIYRAGGTASKTMTSHPYDYSKAGNLHGIWGGVVLCGNAFVNDNTRTPNLGQATYPVEGVGVDYNLYGGGRDDDDSSGIFRYVQIRYGGYPLADTKEINGLTMYGVGRGTELHHVEVFCNHDDAFEWFGGTVNGKYLVAYGAGDDTFDSDCGYRGKNQFLFGVQKNLGGTKYESGCSDKGMEMDSTEGVCVSSPSNTGMQEPEAASAWYNITLVGWNGDVKSSKWRNGAVTLRDDATPQIWNSVFMNFGGFGTLVENKASVGNYYSAYHFNTDNALANWTVGTTTNLVIGTNGLASASVGTGSDILISPENDLALFVDLGEFVDQSHAGFGVTKRDLS